MRRSPAFILSLLLVISPFPAWSEVLRVASPENVVPMCFEKGGETVGIFVDVSKKVASRMKLDADVKAMPMKRVFLNMKNGDADMMGPLVYSDERAKFVSYLSTPVFTIKQAIYGHKADYFPYHSTQDLYGKTVGKRRGFHLEKEFAKAESIEVLEANSFPQLFKLLAKKRVKYIVFPEFMVSLNRERLPSDGVVLGYLGSEMKVFMAVSRKSPFIDRHDEMNQILKELQADGTLKRIREKYLGQ